MHAIKHRLAVRSSPAVVFAAISLPTGLNAWWTKECEGEPTLNAPYRFYFSDEFDWEGTVTDIEAGLAIEWRFTNAEPDWTGTRLRIELEPEGEKTWISFLHDGWKEDNDHFCHTSFCWAQYLRLLRRWIEEGMSVAYEKRGTA
jgi:uncharacterized protein YndB with AHSA1/START domain